MTEYADIENPTDVSVTMEEFLADLDEAGFQKAIGLSDKKTSPKQVSAFVSRAPDRLIVFGYVNPTDPSSGDEILKQREELGLFELKLYPTTDGYLVNDPDAFPVYEAASGIGMPDPGDLLKHSDPALIDEVAYSFPELEIVLAHLGYPRVDETIYVARKHANVWCDISWRARRQPSEISPHALAGPPHRPQPRSHQQNEIWDRLPRGPPETLHGYAVEHQQACNPRRPQDPPGDTPLLLTTLIR